MFDILAPLAALIGIGAAWRYVKPLSASADGLQRQLFILVYSVLLPIVVFFACRKFPLDSRAFNLLLIVGLATAGAAAAAWFYLKQSKLPPRAQGALLLAAAIGSVEFLGLPVSGVLKNVANWSGGRDIGVEFMLVANVLILLTGGVFLLRGYGGLGRAKNPVDALMREPILWAAVAGLLVGMSGMELPAFLYSTNNAVMRALPAIMLITVGLSLQWKKEWNDQIAASLLPVAVIKLLLVPVLIYVLAKFLGGTGASVKSLMIYGALPSTLFGFILCERYKLDTNVYAAAVAFTTVLSFVVVPVLYDMAL